MKGSDEEGKGESSISATVGRPHGCLYPLTLIPPAPQGSVGSVVLGQLQVLGGCKVQIHAVGKGLVWALLALNPKPLRFN